MPPTPISSGSATPRITTGPAVNPNAAQPANPQAGQVQYFVFDAMAFDTVFNSAVRNSTAAPLFGRDKTMERVDRAVPFGIDDSTAPLGDYSSHYTWLWQHPGAVVNLYFTQNIAGFAQTINLNNNAATVKTNVTSSDLTILSGYEMNRDNRLRAESLKRSAEILNKLKLHFDEKTFLTGRIDQEKITGRLTRAGIVGPEADAALNDLRATAAYLRNWYENVSRITQPVSGVQYEKMVRNQLKAKKGDYSTAELWEAVSHIPAPVLERRLQMIQGEKILALKESLFSAEAGNIRAGQKPTVTERDQAYFNSASVDGDFLVQFVEKYGHLIGSSEMTAIVGGEHEEVLHDSAGREIKNPKDFLMEYGRRLRAGKRTLSLAINPNDSEEDRAAKLFLQSAITLWEPGSKEDYLGALQRYTGDLQHLGAANLIGMDETTINFPLRFKSALLRLGFQAGSDFSLTDPKSKGKVTAEQIHFMADRFEKYWNGPTMTAESRRQFAEALEVSEVTIEGYIRTMKETTVGLDNFKYTDNRSELGRAMIFFTKNIVPSFVPPVEGEADSNTVDLPLYFFQKTHGIEINNIGFGQTGGTEAIDTQEREEASTGLVDQLGGAMAKGVHFSLFMHPSIQLGLQGGFITKMIRAGIAGDTKQMEEIGKEWVRTRLNFFAFQYNPLALFRSGINNMEKGDWASGIVDVSFALGFYRVVKNQLQNLKKAYNLAAAKLNLKPLSLEADQALPKEMRLLTERLIDQSTTNPRLRWTLKRAMTTGKDFFFEPITTSAQLLDLTVAQQHTFWKNMISLANDPNRIIDVDGLKVGDKTVSFKMRAGDMLAIYRQAISPSVYNRAVHGMTQFIGVPGEITEAIRDLAPEGSRFQRIPDLNVGHVVDHLSKPLTRPERILQNLAADNASAVRTGGLTIRQLEGVVAQLSHEAGLVASGQVKTSTSGKAVRAFRWLVFNGLLQTDENKIKMNQIEGAVGLREHFRGSRAAMGKELAGQLQLLNEQLEHNKGLGTEVNSLYDAYFQAYEKQGLFQADVEQEYMEIVESNPRLKPEQAMQRAQQTVVGRLRGEYMDAMNTRVLDHLYSTLDKHFTPDELAAINTKQDGILTKKQFAKVLAAEQGNIRTEIQAFDSRLREAISRAPKPGAPQLVAANRGLPEASEVLPIDAELTEPAAAPRPFDLNEALRDTGMQVEVNGSLDNLPLETQRQFVDAVRRAKERGMEKLTIRPEVKFAGGGEGAYANLTRVLTGENVPRTLEVVVHNNQVNFKGPNVSLPGTLMVIPLQSEMAAGLNGSGSLEHPAVNPNLPLTVDQIAERFKVSKTEAKQIAADASRLRADNEVAKQKAMAKVQGDDPAATTKRARIAENFDLELRDAEGTAQEMRSILGDGAKISGEVRSTVKVIDGLHGELIAARRAGNKQEAARLEGEINAKAIQLEKLTNPLTRRVNRFAGEHGPTMVILLGVELGMALYHGQIKGAKDVALHSGMTIASYFAFMGAESGLTAVLDVAKGKAGPLTGAAMGVALAVLRHNKSLVSSNSGARTAAIADIVKEGIAGYWATKAGTLAAAPLAENPVLAAVVGVGVGIVVYSGIAFGGEIFGYDKWLNRQTTAGEISDSFEHLTRTIGWQLNVRSGSIDSPYFNNLTEPVHTADGIVMASKAQTFLGIMQAAENFRAMTPADREKFIKENGPVGQNIANTFNAMRQLDSFEVGSYDDLAPETMDKVAEAITAYRKENNLSDATIMIDGRPQRVEHRFNVKLTRRTEPINNPLTGETAGHRTYYDIDISATRYVSTPTTERSLSVQSLGQQRTVTRMVAGQTFPAKTYNLGGMEGNLDKLSNALLLSQAEQINEGNQPNTFNLTMQQLIDNNMSLPLANLDRFPLVKREMATHLAHLGYTVYNQSGGVDTGLLLSSYMQFSRETGNPIEIQVPRNLSLMPGFALPTAKPNDNLFFPVANPDQPTIISVGGQLNPGLLRAGQDALSGRQPSRIMPNNTMRIIGNQLNPSSPLSLPIASNLGLMPGSAPEITLPGMSPTGSVNFEVTTMRALVQRDS